MSLLFISYIYHFTVLQMHNVYQVLSYWLFDPYFAVEWVTCASDSRMKLFQMKNNIIYIIYAMITQTTNVAKIIMSECEFLSFLICYCRCYP